MAFKKKKWVRQYMANENETTEDYIAKLNIEGERNVWLGNRPKIKYIFAKSKKYLKSKMSVCEIGIGDGHLLRLLNRFGLKSTGIDISTYLVKKLGEIFEDEGIEVNFLQHDFSEPICYEAAFDAVFCLDVLEHIENVDGAIRNIKKMLKSGGILVATMPWKENLDNNRVICPKCHHKFHRIGHYHSFNSYRDIVRILGNNFHILTFGFIPSKELEGIVIELFKKTLFRRKYYKDGLPNFLTTCFFVARLEK
jgi:SAM-dependent methyltransferase